MIRRSNLVTVLAIALAASACTPSGSTETTTTTTAEQTTTTAPGAPPTGDTTTTAPSAPTTTVPPLTPPATPDKEGVALDAIVPVEGFELITDLSGDDFAMLALFDAWLPNRLIDGVAAAMFEGAGGERVAVVSTIPLTGLRGDPNLAAFYATSAGGGESEASVIDGITTIVASSGGSFEIWSDGDGVLVATADDASDAHRFMVAMATADTPNDVWEAGSCLYLAPSVPPLFGEFPYAPFMDDLVVPCNGPHNAEVIHAEFEGTSDAEFEAEAIHYLRNYECDREYRDTFGLSVTDHRASLITYMPDADEWDRGDRYLACVVALFDDDGEPELFEGNMADRTGLDVVISPGDCTDGSISNVVDCATVHSQQYVGSVVTESETYPVLGDDEFDDLCSVYLEDLTTSAEAEVQIVGVGLMPYSFEIGDREVRCYASAFAGFLSVDVVGSFFGRWAVVDEDATSA